MNDRLPFLLAALLACAPSAFAQLTPVRLEMRELPGFHRAGYRVDQPAQAPQPPQQITHAQQSRVRDIMSGQHGGAAGIPVELRSRVGSVILTLDKVADDRVTAADWDRRIAEFERGFAAAFPPGSTPSAEQWEAGIDDLIGALIKRDNDPHTAYFSREDWTLFRESYANNYVGVGVLMSTSATGLKALQVVPGSPAREAGIAKGDVITAVDRVPAAGMSLDEAVDRIRGVPDTPVELRVAREGAPDRVLTLTRQGVESPNVFSRMIGTNVGYVYLAMFNANADQAVFRHIDALRSKGATRLVMDVRGNPGGGIDIVQSIASEFLQDGQVINTTRQQGVEVDRAVTVGAGRYADMPLAVLIDTGSASASELLAAAMQDHARAWVVGWQSFGKGTFQNLIPTQIGSFENGQLVVRDDGTAIKVTGGGWYTPRGLSINGRFNGVVGPNGPGPGGVAPHVVIPLSEEQAKPAYEGLFNQLYQGGPAAASDPVLDAAVSILSGRRS